MQQIYPYVSNTNVYDCPGNVRLPSNHQGPFDYFNGCNAAYVATGGFAAVKSTAILFPSAYVLGGDTAGTKSNGTGLQFNPLDADKDDYSQNCVGGAAATRSLNSGKSTARARTSCSPMATPNGIKSTTPVK